MSLYNPKNWYWQIGDDTSRWWSSKDKAYVTELPGWIYPNGQAVLDAGLEISPATAIATRIASEIELYDVLVKAKAKAYAPTRSFTAAEVREALLSIDAGVTGDANDVESLTAVAEEIEFNLPPFA